MKHCTKKGKFYLQRNYARCILQLVIETKTLSRTNPHSKLYRKAKVTIEAIGQSLAGIEQRWLDCEIGGAIIQELQNFA